jgi:hypothetical protein
MILHETADPAPGKLQHWQRDVHPGHVRRRKEIRDGWK